MIFSDLCLGYILLKKKSYQSLCNLDMVKGGLLPPLSTACLPSQSRSDAPICVCRRVEHGRTRGLLGSLPVHSSSSAAV